jgi:ABC-type transport system involved in multi-copper enzyme maturation permease subunit
MRARNVLRQVAWTELALGLRRFAFWFMAAVFAAIGYFYFTKYVAVSPGEDSLTQGVKLGRNSAYSLSIMLAVLGFLFMHFIAALTVDPVLRDRRIGLLPLVVSSPVEERTYVLGKFLGALVLPLAVPLFFIAVAAIMQFVPNPAIGLVPPNAIGFVVAYVQFYLPWVILVAGLVFALAIATGSPKLVYSLVTLFFIAYFIAINLVQKVEHRWVSYLDPTGLIYLAEVEGTGKTNIQLNALTWLGGPGFLLNRIGVVLAGLIPLLLVAHGFARREASAGRAGRTGAVAHDHELGHPVGPLRPLPAQVPLAIGRLRQLRRVAAAEIRLLSHERSLCFLIPLLAVILWSSVDLSSGPFGAERVPVSSEVARSMFWTLVMFLFGTTTFFIGETIYREREEGLADTLHAYPVPEMAIIGGKVIANLVLCAGLVAVAFLTAIAYQLIHRGGPVDLRPFLVIFGFYLAPTVLLMVTLAAALSIAARSKPGGYALFLAAGGGLVWAFVRGHRHWLYNLPGLNLTTYSDMVGIGPLRTEVVMQRFYVVAIAGLLFCIAVALYPRTGGAVRRALAPGEWRRRGAVGPAIAFLLLAALLGVGLHVLVEGGMGSLAFERLRVRYEKDVRPWLFACPEPEIAGVDLDLDLYPERNAFALAGDVCLRNVSAAAIDSVHVTVYPPLLEKGVIRLDGRPPARYEVAVATFALPAPLEPGAEARLTWNWRGRIPDGPPRHGGGLDTFIEPGGSYLHSFAALPWLPIVGYAEDMEIGNDRTRRKFDLPKRDPLPESDGTGQTPGLMRQTFAYPYRARIRVPAGEGVLSAGNLVAQRDVAGGRREFEYVSDGPIYFFPIMAGRWDMQRKGANGVYYAAAHAENAPKILDALVKSRETYSTAFSPFPYAELRIAEFPRLATFAMGYPTLIPFSEGIGFLTRDSKDRPNLNFYVTAHEVAHQWWGTVIWPGHAKGAGVITEGLANYSALLMAERYEGEAKRHQMFEDYEDRYLRRRDANEEQPLALVDGTRRGDEALSYNRGGIVFYMLHRRLGEERMLAGLGEFIRRFSFQADHPTMTDLRAVFTELHPETAPLFAQYVFGKAIPDPYYARVGRAAADGGAWRVAFTVENRASGDLDLVVAASAGEKGKADYRESRAAVALRGTAPVTGEIACDFKPERVEMDPDRTVLLQERKQGRRDL